MFFPDFFEILFEVPDFLDVLFATLFPATFALATKND